MAGTMISETEHTFLSMTEPTAAAPTLFGDTETDAATTDEELAAVYWHLITSNRLAGYGRKQQPLTAIYDSFWYFGTSLAYDPYYDPIPDMFSKQDETAPPAPTAARPAKRQRVDSLVSADQVHTQQAIPDDIMQLAATIKSLPITSVGRRTGHDFPSRHRLRRCDGLEGEVSRKTGVLTLKGQLRAWKGDSRLFSEEWWGYLCEEGYENGGCEVEEVKSEDGGVVLPRKRQRTAEPSPRKKQKTKVQETEVVAIGRKTFNSILAAP
ncbi:hypothetical protein LTR56_014611 [Elasticomyces elasticus]|nr:hypothetical protein LTR56_014611 [Elasticomyces elasticus]KAK3646757.1 hypothetical protein LTR22_014133 [Elasticomyces elasticus]KAK4916401.1 hypothetical protein LTR49_015635 [Elasticomyces elasticus]KAK5749066.1 hypothetical protein LTS12_020897 [Elasticomyces elasticus]